MHRVGVVLLAVTLLGGCATTNSAAPNLFQGYYFMAGDADCVRYAPYEEDDRAIQCYDAKGRFTTYRRAMTVQEVQMYQASAAQRRVSDNEFYRDLSEGNQAMANASYPHMATPQITPLGNSQVRCISTGFYTNCQRY